MVIAMHTLTHPPGTAALGGLLTLPQRTSSNLANTDTAGIRGKDTLFGHDICQVRKDLLLDWKVLCRRLNDHLDPVAAAVAAAAIAGHLIDTLDYGEATPSCICLVLCELGLLDIFCEEGVEEGKALCELCRRGIAEGDAGLCCHGCYVGDPEAHLCRKRVGEARVRLMCATRNDLRRSPGLSR